MSFTRSRLFQAVLLLVTCGVMAAVPLVNHFRADRPADWPAYADAPAVHAMPSVSKNKDYPLWYYVGRMVVEDATLRERSGEAWTLYPTDPNTTFPFMYPPFAALCLGLLSLLGPTGMLIALILLNVASVAVVVELSVRMAAGTATVSPWLRVIPAAVCLFFLNDMFLLGQPNLGLLAVVLGGLMLVRSGTAGGEAAGGGLFALATAIKAFPAVVIVYLLWRRRWVAAAAMVGFCGMFFLAVPVAVRGWDRSLLELKTWADGMLFRQGEKGHGQRPEQSVGFRNQSLFGVGNRFLRHANARAEETPFETAKQLQYSPLTGCAAPVATALQPGSPGEPLYVNVLDLDYRGAMLGTLAAAGALGVGFILVMPRRAARTRGTDALEFALLVVLMTVGTPYAFGYYFVWLIYPLTVLVHRGMTGPPTDRMIAWGGVVGVTLFFALSGLVVVDYLVPMAYGSLFWAAMTAVLACGWLLARSGSPHSRATATTGVAEPAAVGR